MQRASECLTKRRSVASFIRANASRSDGANSAAILSGAKSKDPVATLSLSATRCLDFARHDGAGELGCEQGNGVCPFPRVREKTA